MMKWLRENLWRHVVGIFMVLFAIFPLYLVVISSINPSGSLQVTSFIPKEFSWKNYQMLFNDPTIPYLTWMKNSLVISVTVALLSVVISASSAFAFSRLKFKGKKSGIQLLLLIQMFPAILALSAVYEIMQVPNKSGVTHFSHLNTFKVMNRWLGLGIANQNPTACKYITCQHSK